MENRPARILVIDDDRDLIELLSRILVREGFEVGGATTAEEALRLAATHGYQLALVDVMLPGMDGFALCRTLRHTPATSDMGILMLTARGDIADKIAGFEAGADDYLTRPFQPKELVYRIRSLLARRHPAPVPRPARSERGLVVAMFGSKGGVGKTTIATNLAVALRQHTRQRVALFDADLFFGDVGVHLNLPTVRTILDMIQSLDGADPEQAEQVLVPHPSGVRVLLSPFRPEEGELITPESIERILEFLRQHYDYIVVDCQPSYDDRMLRILESADEVLMVVTPEVGPLKNTSLFLDLAVRLGYSLDKINVALNRFNSNVGIGPEEIERTLQHEVAFRIISGGRPVVLSVNRGVPLVIEQPDHPFSVQIMRIADHYIQRALNGPSQAPSRSLRGRSAEAEG
jgi:pilus assembly protein CpaE